MSIWCFLSRINLHLFLYRESPSWSMHRDHFFSSRSLIFFFFSRSRARCNALYYWLEVFCCCGKLRGQSEGNSSTFPPQTVVGASSFSCFWWFWSRAELLSEHLQSDQDLNSFRNLLSLLGQDFGLAAFEQIQVYQGCSSHMAPLWKPRHIRLLTRWSIAFLKSN